MAPIRNVCPFHTNRKCCLRINSPFSLETDIHPGSNTIQIQHRPKNLKIIEMRANFLVQSALMSIVSAAMASAWSANRKQYYQPSASGKSCSGRLADNFKQTLSVDMDKLYDGKKYKNGKRCSSVKRGTNFAYFCYTLIQISSCIFSLKIC